MFGFIFSNSDINVVVVFFAFPKHFGHPHLVFNKTFVCVFHSYPQTSHFTDTFVLVFLYLLISVISFFLYFLINIFLC